MSDGALSPEAVRAFSLCAKLSDYVVNTGEGSLTSNHLYTLRPDLKHAEYLEIIKSTPRAEFVFKVMDRLFNRTYAIITMSLGADAVGIARGFMMSGGCIRARMCSGYGGHKCPVGMATQDPKKRASFLVVKRGHQMANYHNNLIKGMKMMLAVMGFDHISKLSKKNLTFKTEVERSILM
jgi:glutamate synthase domain-containing protein 2